MDRELLRRQGRESYDAVLSTGLVKPAAYLHCLMYPYEEGFTYTPLNDGEEFPYMPLNNEMFFYLIGFGAAALDRRDEETEMVVEYWLEKLGSFPTKHAVVLEHGIMIPPEDVHHCNYSHLAGYRRLRMKTRTKPAQGFKYHLDVFWGGDVPDGSTKEVARIVEGRALIDAFHLLEGSGYTTVLDVPINSNG